MVKSRYMLKFSVVVFTLTDVAKIQNCNTAKIPEMINTNSLESFIVYCKKMYGMWYV